MDPPDEDDLTGETLASEFSAMRGLRGLSRSSPQDRSSRLRTEEELRRDGRLKDSEDLTYSMFDDPLDTSTKGALGGGEGREEGVGYGFSSRLAKRPPKTNQDAADAAGASVVAALMEVRSSCVWCWQTVAPRWKYFVCVRSLSRKAYVNHMLQEYKPGWFFGRRKGAHGWDMRKHTPSANFWRRLNCSEPCVISV